MRLNTRRGVRVVNRGSGSYTLIERLFRTGRLGMHYEVQDPTTVLRRRNRLTYSSDFTNETGWPRLALVTVHRRADGVGDGMVATTAVGAHAFVPANYTVIGTYNTLVVRIKPGLCGWVALSVGGSLQYFNITTGALGSLFPAAGIPAPVVSCTAVTEAGYTGYYDCRLTGLATTTSCNIIPARANGTINFGGDGTAVEVYVARAQLDLDSTPSAYQDITDWTTEFKAELARTQVPWHIWQDLYGKIPICELEQPIYRWEDWSGWNHHLFQASSPARAVLSKRWNRAVKSEQLDDTAWTKSATAVTKHTTEVGPFGRLTVSVITNDGSGNQHLTYPNGLAVASAPNKVVVYAKAGTTPLFQIGWFAIAEAVNFNVTLGTQQTAAGTAVGTITPVAGAPGWYRCEATSTLATNSTPFIGGIAAITDGHAPFFVSAATILIGGFDWRTTADWALPLPPYQRVNTATDYDDVSFPAFLRLDGVDDYYWTNSPVDATAYHCMTSIVTATYVSVTAGGALWGTLKDFTPYPGDWDMVFTGAFWRLRLYGANNGRDAEDAALEGGATAVMTARADQRADLGGAVTAQAWVNGAHTGVLTYDFGTQPQTFRNATIGIAVQAPLQVPSIRLFAISTVFDTVPLSEALIDELEARHAALARITL